MAIFQTKFGDLNLSSWTGSSSATNKTSGLTSKPYSFIFTVDGDKYRFIPEDVIQRGFTDPDTKRQFYLTNALDKNTLKSLYEKGEAVDLSGGLTASKANQLESLGYSTKGVLVPDSDYQSLGLNKVRSYEPGIISKGAGVGFITGLGQDKKGNLMYGGEQLGRSQYAYIDQEGRKAGYEKSAWGGFLGDMFYDIGKAIAGVPFLPEVLGVATGNPYVYASAKGLSAGASGEDPLEAGLKIGATIGVTQALSGPGEGGGQPAPVGGTPGVSEVFPVAPPGGTVAPLPPQAAGASLAAGAPIVNATPVPAGELAFPAREVAANYTPVPGSFQAALPGLGVETAASAAPYTAAAGSFAAALPSLLTPTASSGLLSVTDALRGANLANQLMGGQQTATGFPQQQAPFQPMGVDYSGIYGLLGQRASVPGISPLLGPAQLRFPSLLG